MTEHTVYSRLDATPVHLDLGARPVVTEPAPGWQFSSIRQPDPRTATPGHAARRISFHLNHDRDAPRRDSGRAAGFMTIPRLFRGQPALPARAQRVSAFDIYSGHFGLTQRPFTLVPDPDFLFWSAEHRSAFAMLEFGVLTGAPITLVTGEIGAGKTTLVQQLLRTLGGGTRIALVSNTGGDSTELLRWVLMALGEPGPRDQSYQGLLAAFRAVLAAEQAAGRRVVLIFDEAQNLDEPALEGLRMLTNMNAGKDEVLQLVLVGQPELRDLVFRPGLYQFAQRVVANFHLNAMDAASTRAYIAHRLRVAGLRSSIFSDAACALIFEATGGIPRRINQLCDLSMVYAFTADEPTIMRHTVQQVLDDGALFDTGLVSRAEPVKAPEPVLQ
jgi:general secretion pathway protein A